MAPVHNPSISTSSTLEKNLSPSPSSSTSTTSTSSTTAKVVTIPTSQFEAAASTLIEAFAVDEVARYFIDTPDMEAYDEGVKWKLHCDIMRYITKAHCLGGLVTGVKDGEEGEFGAVALWLPPHTSIDGLLILFRSGLWRLFYKLSREGRKRFYTEFMPLLHDTKRDVLGKKRDVESYYLVYLGSRKSARGKGFARLLIEDMCLKADKQNLPTYLESSARNNLSYYKKYGFEEIKDIYLNRGKKPIALHIMVREARSVSEGKEKEKIEEGKEKEKEKVEVKA